jgi:fibro-slime domain-containing protein
MALPARCFAAALLAAPTALGGGPAHAAELAVTYFTVAALGDPDFRTPCCVFVRNMVLPTLGPHRLPLLNPGFIGSNSYTIHDLNAAGEITWWSPGPTIAATGTGLTRLPIDNGHFFPPNGTGADNLHGFQTAVFRGVLHIRAAGPVSFKVAADDAAFVYVDGELVADLGGVHPAITLPVVTKTLAPRDYCLEIFYADLFPTRAELRFSVETPNVTVTQTAETDSAVCLALTS